MPRVRNYFRTHRTFVAVGGTYDEVVFSPLPEAEVYHIMRLAVEDEDTTLTGDVRIYVEGHGFPHWLMSQATPTGGQLYWDRWPTFLLPGEKLVARFYGATANDVLQFYIEGWFWLRPPESPNPLPDSQEDQG